MTQRMHEDDARRLLKLSFIRRYGVFENGVFQRIDSERAPNPAPSYQEMSNLLQESRRIGPENAELILKGNAEFSQQADHAVDWVVDGYFPPHMREIAHLTRGYNGAWSYRDVYVEFLKWCKNPTDYPHTPCATAEEVKQRTTEFTRPDIITYSSYSNKVGPRESLHTPRDDPDYGINQVVFEVHRQHEKDTGEELTYP